MEKMCIRCREYDDVEDFNDEGLCPSCQDELFLDEE